MFSELHLYVMQMLYFNTLCSICIYIAESMITNNRGDTKDDKKVNRQSELE